MSRTTRVQLMEKLILFPCKTNHTFTSFIQFPSVHCKHLPVWWVIYMLKKEVYWHIYVKWHFQESSHLFQVAHQSLHEYRMSTGQYTIFSWLQRKLLPLVLFKSKSKGCLIPYSTTWEFFYYYYYYQQHRCRRHLILMHKVKHVLYKYLTFK